MGEYWSHDGWKPADHLSIRETVRKSLEEMKEYWLERGVWPDTEPIDLYGPAVEDPDKGNYMDLGGDPIPDREALENAYLEEYPEKGRLAFQSEAVKRFIEYRENLKEVVE